MKTYCFIGNATVGSYVERRLEADMSLAATLEDADCIITYCTNATALEDAYFDEGGIVKRARKNTLLIDLSPATTALAREISAVATVNGLRPVEAPLAALDAAAPDAFARADNFVCYAAGESDDVSEAREVLNKLAGLVKETGATGTSQLAKAAHTIQLAAQLLAAAEADALRRQTEAAFDEIAQNGSAVEPLSDISAHALDAISSDVFEGGFTVEMMLGDIAAALEATEELSFVAPQLEAAFHVFEMLAIVGGADFSPAAISLLYRDEDEASKHGLDWKRADALFDDGHGHEHAHEHAHGHAHAHAHGMSDEHGFYEDYDDELYAVRHDDDDDELDGYDDYNERFSFGGFGVYSEH